jgi:hypothetical protein
MKEGASQMSVGKSYKSLFVGAWLVVAPNVVYANDPPCPEDEHGVVVVVSKNSADRHFESTSYR